MGFSIHFYRQTCVAAEEVEDIRSGWMLSAKPADRPDADGANARVSLRAMASRGVACARFLRSGRASLRCDVSEHAPPPCFAWSPLPETSWGGFRQAQHPPRRTASRLRTSASAGAHEGASRPVPKSKRSTSAGPAASPRSARRRRPTASVAAPSSTSGPAAPPSVPAARWESERGGRRPGPGAPRRHGLGGCPQPVAEEALPNARWVSLAMVGSGRTCAFRCVGGIRPGVDSADKDTAPLVWSVAGLTRSAAHLISTVEGRAAF